MQKVDVSSPMGAVDEVKVMRGACDDEAESSAAVSV